MRPEHQLDGRGAALGGVIVRDQRMRRRRAAGLANAHAGPERQHCGEVGRKSTVHREPRPEHYAYGHDIYAAPALRKPRDRHAEQRVKHCEGEAVQETQLAIGDSEAHLPWVTNDVNDTTVEKIERVDQR